MEEHDWPPADPKNWQHVFNCGEGGPRDYFWLLHRDFFQKKNLARKRNKELILPELI